MFGNLNMKTINLLTSKEFVTRFDSFHKSLHKFVTAAIEQDEFPLELIEEFIGEAKPYLNQIEDLLGLQKGGK